MTYQILLLGSPNQSFQPITDQIAGMVKDLGVEVSQVQFLYAGSVMNADPRFPRVAIYYGSPDYHGDDNVLKKLIEDSIVIIPLVSSIEAATAELPPNIAHINAIETTSSGFSRTATLVLENLQLLRKERRLFISYKRSDAQEVANQLYDELDKRGFDVFIDVRSVPPAADFQAELWHRMSDSDIVIMLDTENFRQSRWTSAELAQANATNIQILHILWPDQKEHGDVSFSHLHHLSEANFSADHKLRLDTETLSKICDQAEELRARALAARFRYLIDNFCDAARDAGKAASVHPQRWISVLQSDGTMLAVVPAIGVPTSNRIHRTFDDLANFENVSAHWLLYDNRGILHDWLKHLDWLGSHLPVKAVKMSEATYELGRL